MNYSPEERKQIAVFNSKILNVLKKCFVDMENGGSWINTRDLLNPALEKDDREGRNALNDLKAMLKANNADMETTLKIVAEVYPNIYETSIATAFDAAQNSSFRTGDFLVSLKPRDNRHRVTDTSALFGGGNIFQQRMQQQRQKGNNPFQQGRIVGPVTPIIPPQYNNRQNVQNVQQRPKGPHECESIGTFVSIVWIVFWAVVWKTLKRNFESFKNGLFLLLLIWIVFYVVLWGIIGCRIFGTECYF